MFLLRQLWSSSHSCYNGVSFSLLLFCLERLGNDHNSCFPWAVSSEWMLSSLWTKHFDANFLRKRNSAVDCYRTIVPLCRECFTAPFSWGWVLTTLLNSKCLSSLPFRPHKSLERNNVPPGSLAKCQKKKKRIKLYLVHRTAKAKVIWAIRKLFYYHH